MTYYKTCPDCGATLDPDEKCDCHRSINAHNVEKYGLLVDHYDFSCEGNCIAQRLYHFYGYFVLMTYHNGHRILFKIL